MRILCSINWLNLAAHKGDAIDSSLFSNGCRLNCFCIIDFDSRHSTATIICLSLIGKDWQVVASHQFSCRSPLRYQECTLSSCATDRCHLLIKGCRCQLDFAPKSSTSRQVHTWLFGKMTRVNSNRQYASGGFACDDQWWRLNRHAVLLLESKHTVSWFLGQGYYKRSFHVFSLIRKRNKRYSGRRAKWQMRNNGHLNGANFLLCEHSAEWKSKCYLFRNQFYRKHW